MKRTICALAALLLAPALAAAADLPLKAPGAIAYAPSSGFYVGIQGSGAKTSAAFDFVTLPGSGNINPAGLVAGGVLGWGAWAGPLYFGVEADAGYDFSKANIPCVVIEDCRVKNGIVLSQRILIGAQLQGLTGAASARGMTAPSQWPVPLALPASVAAANVMPYLTAGVVETSTKACLTGVVDMGCSQQWMIGFEAGGGLRVPVSQHVSLDLTYLYDRFNKHFVPMSGPAIFPVDFKAISEHKARVSVIGHF